MPFPTAPPLPPPLSERAAGKRPLAAAADAAPRVRVHVEPPLPPPAPPVPSPTPPKLLELHDTMWTYRKHEAKTANYPMRKLEGQERVVIQRGPSWVTTELTLFMRYNP